MSFEEKAGLVEKSKLDSGFDFVFNVFGLGVGLVTYALDFTHWFLKGSVNKIYNIAKIAAPDVKKCFAEIQQDFLWRLSFDKDKPAYGSGEVLIKMLKFVPKTMYTSLKFYSKSLYRHEDDIIDDLKNYNDRTINFIKSGIESFSEFQKEFFETYVIPAFRSKVRRELEAPELFKKQFQAAEDSFVTYVMPHLSYAASYAASSTVSGLSYAASSTVSGLSYAASSTVSGLSYAASSTISGLSYASSSIVSGVYYAGSSIVSGVYYAGSSTISGVSYAASSTVSGVSYAGSSTISGVSYAASSTVSGLSYAASSAVTGVSYAGSSAVSVFSFVLKKIKSVFEGGHEDGDRSTEVDSGQKKLLAIGEGASTKENTDTEYSAIRAVASATDENFEDYEDYEDEDDKDVNFVNDAGQPKLAGEASDAKDVDSQ